MAVAVQVGAGSSGGCWSLADHQLEAIFRTRVLLKELGIREKSV